MCYFTVSVEKDVFANLTISNAVILAGSVNLAVSATLAVTALNCIC